MKTFLSKGSAFLAPHGKTTMAPALFDLQLADGAWAITVSTPHQVQVLRRLGYKRIFMANQLVGARAISFIISEMRADPSFQFIFLIDSTANLDSIVRAARAANLDRPLEVLLEIGYKGGRTGCRDLGEALDLARRIDAVHDVIQLRGIEGFEGLLKGASNAETLIMVREFLTKMVSLAHRCDAESLLQGEPLILSAGGSSYYDIVVEILGSSVFSKPTMVLVRSGCYITHDSVLYAKAVTALKERNPELAVVNGGLSPALEVWGYVQSRPEEEKLIAALGKRDVSYDDQPIPLMWFRPGSEMTGPEALSPDHLVTRLNDQHCHVSIPAGSLLNVGDMIGFGISHPCLTFDKWKVLHVVDDDYRVTSSIRTYF